MSIQEYVEKKQSQLKSLYKALEKHSESGKVDFYTCLLTWETKSHWSASVDYGTDLDKRPYTVMWKGISYRKDGREVPFTHTRKFKHIESVVDFLIS